MNRSKSKPTATLGRLASTPTSLILRDRLIVAKELLTDSGSIFVQISDENVHRVRCLMDEVFGGENFIGEIVFQKTSFKTSDIVQKTFDYLLLVRKKCTHSKS